MRVEDHDLPEDFGVMLIKAKRYAANSWESELVSDLDEKYDAYGDSMFLSEKQYLHFRMIYNRSSHST